MPIEFFLSAGAVILAAIPVVKLTLLVVIRYLPGFLEHSIHQIKKDTQFTSLRLTIPELEGAEIGSLGELFGANPDIIKALDAYVDYARMVHLFIESLVLGMLSILASLILSLGEQQLWYHWRVILQGIVFFMLGIGLFFGYRRHLRKRNDPARITIARNYWIGAVAFDLIAVILESTRFHV